MPPKHAFVIWQALLGSALILPLGLWRFTRGDIAQGLFDVVLTVLFIVLGLIASYEKHYVRASRVFAFLYTVAVWIVIQFIGPLGLFWAFATTTAIFFASRRRDALMFSTLTYLAAIYGVWGQAEPEAIYTFSATYLLVAFFCYQFANRLYTDNSRLKTEATTDALTQASNRRAMDDFIQEHCISLAKRSEVWSAMMIDIDDFKRVNDQLGHNVGDLVLQRAAGCISRALETSGRLFRYGGEEFVVLVPLSLMHAQDIAERIRANLELEDLLRSGFGAITCSIGVAELQNSEDARSWLRRADEALYNAKNSGKNCVCLA